MIGVWWDRRNYFGQKTHWLGLTKAIYGIKTNFQTYPEGYVEFLGPSAKFPRPGSYPMLRNSASGPEIGLPGQISAGF
jgi:hypothetical protein